MEPKKNIVPLIVVGVLLLCVLPAGIGLIVLLTGGDDDSSDSGSGSLPNPTLVCTDCMLQYKTLTITPQEPMSTVVSTVRHPHYLGSEDF